MCPPNPNIGVPPIPTNKETLQEGTPAVPQSSTILQPPAVIPPPNTNPSSSNISHSNIPISHLPPETPPCGGRLQFFIGAWSRITQDPWVLQVVCGYQLDFSSHPPLRRPRHTQPALARDQTQVIEAEIQSLLEKQAIVRLTTPLSPVFYSSVFVVPKKDRGWRPIINLRELNRYVISPHFKMENISNLKDVILPGDWMCKIDLKILTHCTDPIRDFSASAGRRTTTSSKPSPSASHQPCVYQTPPPSCCTVQAGWSENSRLPGRLATIGIRP